MAKMFYTLEEAAQRLGVSPDDVKQLAADGKIQQFRDRDKLMFKRDQVDAAAAKSGGATQDSGAPIELVTSGETDKFDLAADHAKGPDRKEDPRQATGISVFDADEVGPSDPLAQTQVTRQASQAEEEISLESVGSGSGLLDLTRESDDTSLGAELLDEIYPAEGSDAKMATAGGLSASIDASGSGVDNLHQAGMPAGMAMAVIDSEPVDAAGSGLSAGVLVGAFISLVLLTIVAVSAVIEVPSGVTRMMASSSGSLLMYSAILLIGSLVLGGIGFAIGKAKA